jgi:hypothetical protein
MKPMGSGPLIAAFIYLAIAHSTSVAASAAPTPEIISTTGTYPLSPAAILTINQPDSGNTLTFSLNESSYGGSSRNIPDTNPGDPFVFYWDNQSATLWWATPVHFGYIRTDKPHSYSSSAHRRAEPLQDYDQFPQLPAAFKTAMEQAIPARK